MICAVPLHASAVQRAPRCQTRGPRQLTVGDRPSPILVTTKKSYIREEYCEKRNSENNIPHERAYL